MEWNCFSQSSLLFSAARPTFPHLLFPSTIYTIFASLNHFHQNSSSSCVPIEGTKQPFTSTFGRERSSCWRVAFVRQLCGVARREHGWVFGLNGSWGGVLSWGDGGRHD